MSCRRQREEGRGEGRRAVKDEEADGEWELPVDEEEEEKRRKSQKSKMGNSTDGDT